MNTIYLTDLRKESMLIKKQTLHVLEDVITRGEYILGPEVEKFEQDFAAYCGAKYCVGVASGTAALFLALVAAGIGPGDEVITTTISFAATVEAIIMCGATPRFVDVVQDNLSLNVDQIESCITSKTKAILPVYLYGFPADTSKIRTLCDRYQLLFIADCAQAHGALVKKETVGRFEDVACFSFMPAKNLGAYGDAGCVVTSNRKMYEILVEIRDHGRKEKYVHERMGYAERIDTVHAAVLGVKLPYLDSWNARRREVASLYRTYFAPHSHIRPLTPFEDTDPSYHQFVICVPKRDQLRDMLLTENIHTGIHYPLPLHLQPSFSYLGYSIGDFPISEKAVKSVLSLPMHPFLTDADVVRVAKAVINHSQ